MYRVVCRLADGSVFTSTTANAFELVSRYITSYGKEIIFVEAYIIKDKTHERQQLIKLGLVDALDGLHLDEG